MLGICGILSLPRARARKRTSIPSNTTHRQHFEQTKSQQFETLTGQIEEDCKRTTNKLPGSLFNRHSTVENFRGTSHGIDPPILCFDRLLRREETTVSRPPLSSAQNGRQRTQKHVRARSQSLNTVVEDPQKPQQSTGAFRAHFPCAYAHRLLESRFATPTRPNTADVCLEHLSRKIT